MNTYPDRIRGERAEVTEVVAQDVTVGLGHGDHERIDGRAPLRLSTE